jgi:hypothetical protein
MIVVNTYIRDVQNIKNAMTTHTFQTEYHHTKKFSFPLNFRTKRGVNSQQIWCAFICTCNGDTLPSPNQRLFSYTARKNLLPHLWLQKRYWCQICFNTRPLTHYPPNLPVGIDLKTVWVQSKQNKQIQNVPSNLVLKEVRFLIQFDAQQIPLQRGILASNFKSSAQTFLPYLDPQFWHLNR